MEEDVPMVWFLYAASVVFVVIGAFVVLYTDWARAWIKRVLGHKQTHLFGLIPLVFGVLMIISAAWSEVFWLVLILGLIALAKGLYLLFARRGQIRLLAGWLTDRPSDQVLRLGGLIMVVLGTTLFSWIR
jgi:uncharacterized protein YjeT (DUF2065 family)